MHKALILCAYGGMVLFGTLHFLIDAVSHAWRGKHPPGADAALYFGLHSAFSLGQLALGLLGLFLAARAIELLGHPIVFAISFAAVLGWLAICIAFIPYWEPRVNMAIVGVMLVAAFLTRPAP